MSGTEEDFGGEEGHMAPAWARRLFGLLPGVDADES